MAFLNTDLLVRGVGLLPRSWIKAVARLQWRHPLAKRAFETVADRMRRRDSRIQQGVGKGLSFNAGISSAGMILGTTEPELQAAFDAFLEPGMCLYDVGANVGFFTVIAARLVGDTGSVIAFDPLPSNIQSVNHNAALNGFKQIVPKEVALGDTDGKATFIISENPNWGQLAMGSKPSRTIGEREVVVRRVDSLVAEGMTPPSALKIDVEGAEAVVLEGALETLRSERPILFVDIHGTNAEVARVLESVDYIARIVGGGEKPLAEGAWDVQIIGIPRERADLLQRFAPLIRPTSS